MKQILILLTLAIISASDLHSQTYDPFFEGSSYACITFPDGTLKIGKARSDGYAIVSTASVAKSLNKSSEDAQVRIRNLVELKQEIKFEGALPKRDMSAIWKSYKKFVKGEYDSELPEVNTRDEQIELINLYIKNYKKIISSNKYQIKVSKDCFNKKPILPDGTLKVEIVATSNGISAVLWGKEEAYLDGLAYCGRGRDGVIQDYVFTRDPCRVDLFSCYRKGYVGINIFGVGTSTPFNPDEIAYWSAYVSERTNGPYEVKLHKTDKNYNFISCDKILP